MNRRMRACILLSLALLAGAAPLLAAGSGDLPGRWTDGKYLVTLALQGQSVTGSFSWTEGAQTRTGALSGAWSAAELKLKASWTWQEEGGKQQFQTTLFLAEHGFTLDGAQTTGEESSPFSLRRVPATGPVQPLGPEELGNVPTPPAAPGIPASLLADTEVGGNGGVTQTPPTPAPTSPLPPQPPASTPAATAPLTGAFICREMVNGTPAGVGTQFAEAPVVTCVVTYANLPPKAQLEFVWLHKNKVFYTYKSTPTNPTGRTWSYFRSTLPHGLLPGQYEVAVKVNGVVKVRCPFVVGKP